MHLRCRLKSCLSLCLEWHEKALCLAAPATTTPLGDSATAECVPNVYRSGDDVSTGLSMPKGSKAVKPATIERRHKYKRQRLGAQRLSLSIWVSVAAWSCQARPEEAQEPTSGTAKEAL
jgi:hypothetical protein